MQLTVMILLGKNAVIAKILLGKNASNCDDDFGEKIQVTMVILLSVKNASDYNHADGNICKQLR